MNVNFIVKLTVFVVISISFGYMTGYVFKTIIDTNQKLEKMENHLINEIRKYKKDNNATRRELQTNSH